DRDGEATSGIGGDPGLHVRGSEVDEEAGAEEGEAGRQAGGADDEQARGLRGGTGAEERKAARVLAGLDGDAGGSRGAAARGGGAEAGDTGRQQVEAGDVRVAEAVVGRVEGARGRREVGAECIAGDRRSTVRVENQSVCVIVVAAGE